MSTWCLRADYSIMLDDPGYGTLEIDRAETKWHVRLAGERLGRLLAAITARALGARLVKRGASSCQGF